VSDPFETVCARLEGHRLRMHGPDRGRACCPAHGGSNPSALSVGRGDNGGVLLKCWNGCEVEQIAHALGLTMGELFPPREAHAGPMRRRRMLPAFQALELLDEEVNFIAVFGANLANGVVPSRADLDRALTAAARVSVLREECRS